LAWVVGIVIVFLIISAVSKAGEAAKKAEESRAFDQALQSRTAAETDRIRREAAAGPLGQMSDNEIRDLIQKSARELKQASDIGSGIGAFILLAGLGFGAFAGFSQERWDPFVIFGLGGLGVGYWVAQLFIKSAKKTIKKRGLDPDRIQIET
jgi:hypothetical protein